MPLESRPIIARAAIAGDYLEVMRIPLRQGRTFSRAEMEALVALAEDGIARLVAEQRLALRR